MQTIAVDSYDMGALLAAMMKEAIATAVNESSPIRDAVEAVRWIFDDGANYRITFREVCEYFKLDPTLVRRRVRRKRALPFWMFPYDYDEQ